MASNSIGKSLKLTTWGESHGSFIGGVLDGVPPKIKIQSKKQKLNIRNTNQITPVRP